MLENGLQLRLSGEPLVKGVAGPGKMAQTYIGVLFQRFHKIQQPWVDDVVLPAEDGGNKAGFFRYQPLFGEVRVAVMAVVIDDDAQRGKPDQ